MSISVHVSRLQKITCISKYIIHKFTRKFFFTIFFLIYFYIEFSKIQAYSDQENNEYYVGEDVTIKANLENITAVLSVSWQYGTDNGSYTIESTLPKYAGTKTEIDQPQLVIRKCTESDRGLYFLLAASTENKDDVLSNEIILDVKRGKR